MILFNQYIAKKLIENNIPAFFRIQPKQVPVIKVPIEDPLYPIKIRVSMPGASLSLTPKPHNTLGVDCYTQGTSLFGVIVILLFRGSLFLYSITKIFAMERKNFWK